MRSSHRALLKDIEEILDPIRFHWHTGRAAKKVERAQLAIVQEIYEDLRKEFPHKAGNKMYQCLYFIYCIVNPMGNTGWLNWRKNPLYR